MKWIPYSKTQIRQLNQILTTTIERTDARKTAMENFSLINNRSVVSVSQKLSSLGRKRPDLKMHKPHPFKPSVRVNEMTIPIISMKIVDRAIIITY